MEQQQVVDVEPNVKETMHWPQNPDGREPSGAASRFLYTGGQQPLSGYTIKRGVGQGGFGEIYYAVSDAGKEVALKLIRRNLEVELRGIRQCLNLKHPHLLSLYDIRQDDKGDTWVVMEYVADQCLENLLAERPNGLPPAQALAWIHGIGTAVAYLHDHGIVHRDLKPGNIFWDEGVVKIGDYGLSKFISCSRRSGHTESIGTVHYMAPEVANGRYGKELDVYAMGVILYELLTGRVPFEGESVAEVLMKHLTARPDVSMLPEPYRSVVAKALEKDPALRYSSADAMLAALPPPETIAVQFSRCPSGDGRARSSPPPMGEGPGVRAAGNAPGAQENQQSAKVDKQFLKDARTAGSFLDRHLGWSQLNIPMKILVLIVGAYAAVNLAPFFGILVAFLAVCAIPLAILYGAYRLVRWLIIGNSLAAASSVPSDSEAAPRRSFWRRGKEKERPLRVMIVKTRRERFTELVGSLLLSALVIAIVCGILAVFAHYERSTPPAEQMAWLMLVSVVGTWGILIPAKSWEGIEGDASTRRFVLMVTGLGVGAAACIAADLFMVDLPGMPNYPNLDLKHLFRIGPNFYASDGHPLMLAYVVCFGSLFLILRWWRQADPLRATRLSLPRLLVCIIVASLLAEIWHFPQPWLPLTAGTISLALQLSSPWVGPQCERQENA